MIAALSHAPAAGARDLWAPGALFPRNPTDASVSSGGVLQAGFAPGGVPPFRAGERDRVSLEGEAGAWIGRRVEVRLSGGWLRDTSEAAGAVSGVSDLRLGTVVAIADLGDFTIFGGWEAKMPNASDEGELGTDETDVLFGATARWARGPWTAQIDLGLGILGNPLRFANQDDVPMARAAVGREIGSIAIRPMVLADLATSRNPARVEAGLDVVAGKAFFGVVHLAAGLTPAAPDARVLIGVGLRSPLPGAGIGD